MEHSLIDAFYNLAKINKIDLSRKANFNPHSIRLMAKKLDLRDMIRLSATNKKMQEIMTPIIEDKRNELEELRVWLSNLPKPQNYTIEELDQLKELYLFNNNLTEIPTLNLPNLKILILFYNKLTSFQPLNLPNLQKLNLSANKLTSISNLNLPNLQLLFLSNNQLTEISNLDLPNLQQFYLWNNPLPETEKARLRSIYGDKVKF